MRTLGLDHGTKRIGMAISDPMGWTARGLGVLDASQVTKSVEALVEIIQAEEVEAVVVGLPRNMDGTLGPRAEDVLEFVRALREVVEVPVATTDERLTSKEADSILRQNRGRKRKTFPSHEERDVVAAQIILTDYLESQRSKGNEND